MVDVASTAGTLFIVGTPIGNLEDITLRALRVLREVSVIAAEDTRRTAQLLARHAIHTPLTSLHEHNEERKTPALLQRVQRGESIALVSDAGTPTVSDPGSGLVRAAIDANLRVESIPGPSAVIAALVVSGLSTRTFTFMGFAPTRSKDRTKWFAEARAVGGTVVFFEAPHRIKSTLEELKAVVGDCRVAVARELTKIHEELVRGPISDVLERMKVIRGEFTVVAEIGHITDYVLTEHATDRELFLQFGVMTKTGAVRRREAIAALARRHARPSSDIYQAIERAKKSGE